MIAFRSIFGFLLILLPCLLSLLPPPLHAAEFSPGLRAVMQSAPPAEPIPVIVTLDKPAEVVALARKHGKKHRTTLVRELKERARSAQAPVKSFLAELGIADFKDLWLINGLAFEAPPEVLARLSNLPEVDQIRLDEVIQLPPVIPSVDSNLNGIEDNIDLINAPELWNLGIEGQGVVVGIMDSGVDLAHPDLTASWRGGGNSWFNPVASTCSNPLLNCTACDLNTVQPCDFLDRTRDPSGIAHGTGVAGVVVGGDASGRNIGVAPGAQWIAAKIFRSDSQAPLSSIHEAFAWMLDPDGNPATDDAPNIVNGSWGLSPGICAEEFRLDVQLLKASGIAVAFASGNSGSEPGLANTSEGPANYPESFAVGSVGTPTSVTDISSFSGRGPSACDNTVYPEVVAPGFDIFTADFSFNGLPGSYITLTGTSFSTPHIAGVMALLVQAFPTATVAQIEEAIRRSATDLGPLGPDNIYGYGLVDALAAYEFFQVPAPVLISPLDGESVPAGDVTLTWQQQPDNFNAPLTNRVLIAQDPAFTTLVEEIVAHNGFAGVMLAGFGWVGILWAMGRRHWPSYKGKAFIGAGMALLITLLMSCSGGGGSDAPPPPPADTVRSITVANLVSGTTYFWKVQALDDRGGVTESEVRSFSVE